MIRHPNRPGPGPSLLLALLLSVLVTACGQRGPLYLPEEAHAQPTSPVGGDLPPGPETGVLPREAIEDSETEDDADRVFADDFDSGNGEDDERR